MIKELLFLLVLAVSTNTIAETLKVNDATVNYKIRSSKHNSSFDKLNLEIEIELVNKRLPNKAELKAVSNEVLKNQPKAYRQWVFFLLPKMKSNAGAYATDHRAPEHEGIVIMNYMLRGTPYEKLAER